MQVDSAIKIMQVIVAIGILVDSLEIIHNKRHLSDSGIFSYRVIRTTHPWLARAPMARFFAAVYASRVLVVILVAQAAAAVLLIIDPLSAITTICVIFLFLARLLVHLRLRYGLDGSDQMIAVILAALVVAHLAPTQATLALTFVALQSLLSYEVAGIAKAISPSWRSGEAIVGILTTKSYGHAAIAQQFLGGRMAPRVLCWSVIGFECFFPTLAFLGSAVVVLIVVGVMFHATIALVMGLNSFFWAFTAAYPAVYVFALLWPDVFP